MATRPNFIDLRSDSQMSTASASSKPPLRSPRLHVAGDVPPELSPLDAFALQSRLLAKQLEDSTRAGNRMSRLPPLTTESPLIVQGRSDYFRSMSQDASPELVESPRAQSPNEGLGLRTEVADAFGVDDRPVSMHPRMSRIPPTPDDGVPLPPQPVFEASQVRTLGQIAEGQPFFGGARAMSPEPIEQPATTDARPEPSARRDNSLNATSGSIATSTQQSPEKQSSFDSTLLPPRTLFPKRSSSIMSSPLEPTEAESAAMAGSFHSLPPRKLSNGSIAMSGPFVSPPFGSFARSPSVASDSSALPRPSFNFSRPLSRSGTPGLETPSRQTSGDSQPSFMPDDASGTPISMNSEAYIDQADEPAAAAPSYIYSKFTLPRGKSVRRSIPLDSMPEAGFLWEQPVFQPATTGAVPYGAPPSPPTRPTSSSGKDAVGGKTSWEQPRLNMGATGQPSPDPSRPSTDGGRSSEEAPRGRALTSPLHETAPRGGTAMSTTTADTAASTVKAYRSQLSHGAPSSGSGMSAEDHLAKGIESHEKGSLKESTYHLRLAARMSHPTAMLLYALACRHGWGMKPNQAEGVQWLRRAAEGASVEIADDEDQAKEGKPVNALERRTRKAQFALSIYELGVSHMNGWGIEQDKALALRCFEIAGSWGDIDALAEAGFCYARGVGCKKDLKKSAKFYRMAEAKGMSMVGNSWIHKSKYTDESPPPKAKDKKKSRSKSRTRTIFGLKSSS